MLEDNDIVSAVLKSSEVRDALRIIVRVAVREAASRATAPLPIEDMSTIGNMTIDRLKHQVTVADEVHCLPPREFSLIETLARRPGVVFSRARLIELVWPDLLEAGIENDRNVDAHIRRLRAKLGPAASIRTVRGAGAGYALDPPKAD
jgi:DNA-binding response OmpR family regulator